MSENNKLLYQIVLVPAAEKKNNMRISCVCMHTHFKSAVFCAVIEAFCLVFVTCVSSVWSDKGITSAYVSTLFNTGCWIYCRSKSSRKDLRLYLCNRLFSFYKNTVYRQLQVIYFSHSSSINQCLRITFVYILAKFCDMESLIWLLLCKHANHVVRHHVWEYFCIFFIDMNVETKWCSAALIPCYKKNLEQQDSLWRQHYHTETFSFCTSTFWEYTDVGPTQITLFKLF